MRKVDQADKFIVSEKVTSTVLETNDLGEIPKNWGIFLFNYSLGRLINNRPSLNELTFNIKQQRLQSQYDDFYKEINAYIDALVNLKSLDYSPELD